MMKFSFPDILFICPKCKPSNDSGGSYCSAIGGGLKECSGRSLGCRIRRRALQRSKRKIANVGWLQKKRGIIPEKLVSDKQLIDSMSNLIAHCPCEKSDETAMEREPSRDQSENHHLAGLHAESLVFDELGKVMQEKSEGEGASWGTSQRATDADSTSATASGTGIQTGDATDGR